MPPVISDDVIILMVGFTAIFALGGVVFAILYLTDEKFREGVKQELHRK